LNQFDLSLAYSPGVAAASMAIFDSGGEAAALYPLRTNLVGVITNGTAVLGAVLGLGNIGPLAAKPVLQGKGCLLKKFAGIDVFHIELAETDPDKLVCGAESSRHIVADVAEEHFVEVENEVN
jgi:malate dehydrogenase (oxaloacetate-decarboxylating)(NADP+)